MYKLYFNGDFAGCVRWNSSSYLHIEWLAWNFPMMQVLWNSERFNRDEAGNYVDHNKFITLKIQKWKLYDTYWYYVPIGLFKKKNRISFRVAFNQKACKKNRIKKYHWPNMETTSLVIVELVLLPTSDKHWVIFTCQSQVEWLFTVNHLLIRR